jgi:hypothetical protein
MLNEEYEIRKRAYPESTDDYDLEEILAQSRHNLKIAKARLDRYTEKYLEVEDQYKDGRLMKVNSARLERLKASAEEAYKTDTQGESSPDNFLSHNEIINE